MLGQYICLNGKFIVGQKAKIDVDNIEFSYGFGVYETIRLRNNKIYFLTEHLERLLYSAELIGLKHNFSLVTMTDWVHSLVKKNKIESANIKMLLIGGQEPQLYIMLLAPVYLEKKTYREGVKVWTFQYERFLPQAKTLNMLPSYLAYREAKEHGAFDSLFIDKKGYILEGTRTNFFAIKNKTLFTTPVVKVLDGVTRRKVIACAEENGYKVVEKNILLKDILDYDGAFLTNTSGKIVPIRGIMNYELRMSGFEKICEEIKNLIKLFDDYLERV